MAIYFIDWDDFMKVIYQNCCGVDVHKKSFVATIAKTNEKGETEYIRENFSTLNWEIQKFHDWLLKNECYHVCMESTGKYWIPIFNYLEDDMDVCLTHPKYVKAIKGKKTDKKDSKWIVDLYKIGVVQNSFIPPKAFRQMRELERYRYKLVRMMASEKNRIQNSMSISNISLANVLSDSQGVTARGILNYLLEHPDEAINPSKIKKLIKGKTKATPDQIIQAIEGFQIKGDQRLKLDLANKHLAFLQEIITNIETELYLRMKPYNEYIDLICEIPGFSKMSAAILIAETGVNMSVFDDSNHLASWAGLSPANNESANKKKSVKISKAGQYIKPLLVECAWSAVKSKKNPYFAIKYQKIKRRRGSKKAIVAIARMMLVCIYHMIKNKTHFKPCDYEELINPYKNQKKVVITEKVALDYLQKCGYDISLIEKNDDSIQKV